MQTLIQVFCKENQKQSLRKIIVNDKNLASYDLKVINEKRQGRPSGWAKIGCQNTSGILNIEWDNNSKILNVRVITRGNSKNKSIIPVFIDYLLARYKSKIKIINILP